MKRTQTTSLILLLAAASGLAAAAPDDSNEKNNKNLLRGPSVVDSSQPAKSAPADGTMTEQAENPLHPNVEDRPLLFREVAMTIRKISGEGEGMLNLTNAQRADLRKIMMENRQKIREFQQEHRDELRKLREAARPESAPDDQRQQKRPPTDADKPMRDGDRGPRGDRGPESDRAAKVREKIQQFMDKAPANKEAMAKIKSLLTPEQNELLKQHIIAQRLRLIERGEHPDAPPASLRGPGDDEDGAPRVRRQRMNRDGVNDAQKRDGVRGKRTWPDDDD